MAAGIAPSEYCDFGFEGAKSQVSKPPRGHGQDRRVCISFKASFFLHSAATFSHASLLKKHEKLYKPGDTEARQRPVSKDEYEIRGILKHRDVPNAVKDGTRGCGSTGEPPRQPGKNLEGSPQALTNYQ